MAGNIFLSLGNISICQEGFSTSVLMKEKCDEYVKSHGAATIILKFFCHVQKLNHWFLLFYASLRFYFYLL